MNVRTLAVSFITGALLFALPSNAKELKDASFGFRLEVPDHFTQLPADPSDPDTIYQFTGNQSTPDAPAQVIQIQRLRGTIAPGFRLKESEFPVTEGMTTTIQDFTWRGLKVDVTRQTLTLPEGLQLVIFSIQYPLSGEAVQLQVGGPASEEQQISSLFHQLAGQFQNTNFSIPPASLAFRKYRRENARANGPVGYSIFRSESCGSFSFFAWRIARSPKKRARCSNSGNRYQEGSSRTRALR